MEITQETVNESDDNSTEIIWSEQWREKKMGRKCTVPLRPMGQNQKI